jgi:DMSO/TMAO reductase YedYZ molybdopterin-dependent catalytic subunit
MEGSKPQHVDRRPSSSAGLTIRQWEPRNLETPFDQLESYLTPTELFYIRSHFPTPTLDVASYRLRVDGAVTEPLSLSLDELRDMPPETRIATLECAATAASFWFRRGGSARSSARPATPSGRCRRVRCWSGLAVGRCLRGRVRRSRWRDTAAPASSARPDPRTWSVPEPVLQPDVLIAYAMNGADLSLDHGFPLRAIVPGHYGMASVKWLTRIEAVREPFLGYWQTTDYAYWASLNGKPVRRALGEMQIKSQIARPRVYETLPTNRIYMICGAAWTGESEVTEVVVETDGGRNLGARRISIPCAAMPGDAGNWIGSRRNSRAVTHCWPAPVMRPAWRNPARTTRTTACTSSITVFRSKFSSSLLARRRG